MVAENPSSDQGFYKDFISHTYNIYFTFYFLTEKNLINLKKKTKN